MKNRNITIKQLILFFEMLENEILDYNKVNIWNIEIKSLNDYKDKIKLLKDIMDYLILYCLENKTITYYFKNKLKKVISDIYLKLNYKIKMYLQLYLENNNYNLDITNNKYLKFAIYQCLDYLGYKDNNNNLLLKDYQIENIKQYINVFDSLNFEIEKIESLKNKINFKIKYKWN